MRKMHKYLAVLFVVSGVAALGMIQDAEGPQIRQVASFWYVCMDFADSMDMQKAERYFQELRSQGLAGKVQGDLFRVLDNYPGLETSVKRTWGLAYRIDEGTSVSPPLRVRRFDFPRAIVIVHPGPFEMAHVALNKVVAFVEEKGLLIAGPPLEIWIGNPASDRPEDLKTEIIVPVREKGA